MKVYKVCSGNKECIYDNLDTALDAIVQDLVCDIDSMEEGDETLAFHIVIGEMTMEEFNDLPEFEGF